MGLLGISGFGVWFFVCFIVKPEKYEISLRIYMVRMLKAYRSGILFASAPGITIHREEVRLLSIAVFGSFQRTVMGCISDLNRLLDFRLESV